MTLWCEYISCTYYEGVLAVDPDCDVVIKQEDKNELRWGVSEETAILLSDEYD